MTAQVIDFTTKTDKAIEELIRNVVQSGKGVLVHISADAEDEVPFLLYRIRCNIPEARALIELAEMELGTQQLQDLIDHLT